MEFSSIHSHLGNCTRCPSRIVLFLPMLQPLRIILKEMSLVSPGQTFFICWNALWGFNAQESIMLMFSKCYRRSSVFTLRINELLSIKTTLRCFHADGIETYHNRSCIFTIWTALEHYDGDRLVYHKLSSFFWINTNLKFIMLFNSVKSSLGGLFYCCINFWEWNEF